jgi:hypothetical protein
MARKVVTELTDDMDGRSEAVETVTFGYRGKLYEIDLSQRNVERLDKALSPFVEKARPVRASNDGRTLSRRALSGSNGKGKLVDVKAVREWARGQGIELKARGRIPAQVVERYKQETGV